MIQAYKTPAQVIMCRHGKIYARGCGTEKGHRTTFTGNVCVSVLPIWHIFERAIELLILSRGVTIVYSSIRNFKNDLQTYKPDVLFVVPRLLEALHKGIREKLNSGKRYTFILRNKAEAHLVDPPLFSPCFLPSGSKAKRRLVSLLIAASVFYTRCFRAARGMVRQS